jgi:hypothetical protein
VSQPWQPTPKPLVVGIVAADTLTDRPGLVWEAFVDAMRALRPQLWSPPPYAFHHPARTRTELQLADRLTAEGRTVTVEPYESEHNAPGTGTDAGQLDRLVRYGFAGLVALVDPDRPDPDHVLGTAQRAYWLHRARVELRIFAADHGGRQPPWTAMTKPDGLDRRPTPPPDPPRRILLRDRRRPGQTPGASAAPALEPPWRAS